MIGMMAKEDEEKSASNEQRRSHGLRLAFWEQALEAFIQSSCRLFDNISPGRDHWLSAGSGLSGMSFKPDLRQKRDTGGVLHVPAPGRDQPAGVRPTVRSEGADRGGIWCRAGMAAPAQPQGLPYPVLPSGGWL